MATQDAVEEAPLLIKVINPTEISIHSEDEKISKIY